MRKYTDYKIGERIQVYTDGDRFSSIVTKTTLWGTVIGRCSTSYNKDCPLLGWKSHEKILPRGNWDIFSEDSGNFAEQMDAAKDLISNITSFKYGWFIYPDESLIVDSLPAEDVLDGKMCGWCGNFYPMAISNQTDGSLKCFSCRDTFKIKKLY